MGQGNGVAIKKGQAKAKRETTVLILHEVEHHLTKLNQSKVTKKQVQESLAYLVNAFRRCLMDALISITAFEYVWGVLVELGPEYKDKERVWSMLVRFQDLILKEDKRLLDAINAE